MFILGTRSSRFHSEPARLFRLCRGLPEPRDRRSGLAVTETGSFDECYGYETRPCAENRC